MSEFNVFKPRTGPTIASNGTTVYSVPPAGQNGVYRTGRYPQETCTSGHRPCSRAESDAAREAVRDYFRGYNSRNGTDFRVPTPEELRTAQGTYCSENPSDRDCRRW